MSIDYNYEKEIIKRGYKCVAGVDEAGRGPLAGPVVAVCAVMPRDFDYNQVELDLIKDSKKVTKKRREYLFDFINSNFMVGVGIVDNQTIDEINILQATFLAMRLAVENASQTIDYVLLDGNLLIPDLNTRQTAIIKGDNKVLSIAAASIIAKVTRDRIMEKAGEKYPGYGFEKHKGYGTKRHKEALQAIGACEIHRKSFAPVKQVINN